MLILHTISSNIREKLFQNVHVTPAWRPPTGSLMSTHINRLTLKLPGHAGLCSLVFDATSEARRSSTILYATTASLRK